MRVDIHVEAPQPLRLARAVLVYSQGETAFATVHDCARVGGKMEILAGRAMTPSMSRSLASALGKEQLIGGYLPGNVLMVDSEVVVWHAGPQIKHLAFKQSDVFPKRSLGNASGAVPMPGTICVAGRNKWAVFAYKGHERPTPQTQLFQAPFYNVDQDGRVCVGNVTLPKSAGIDRIAAWNDAFFRSFFSHANYDGVVDYPEDATGLWRTLLAAKKKRFPENVLKPYKRCLGELIADLRRC